MEGQMEGQMKEEMEGQIMDGGMETGYGRRRDDRREGT